MAPGSRARKGASVALYYLAQSPGSAQGLAGAMMELGCTRTHDARPCVSWGGSTTAPAAAGCAASVGEAVGWCWVDEGHTEWAYCEPNCRWEAESPGHFNLRDPEKFPVLDEAARHLHAAEPDVESARKVLSKAVDASHSVIEQHWLNGGKSKVRPEISFHLDQTRQTFAVCLQRGVHVRRAGEPKHPPPGYPGSTRFLPACCSR